MAGADAQEVAFTAQPRFGLHLTPPELSPRVLPHRINHNISYFVRPFQIFPAWHIPGATVTNTLGEIKPYTSNDPVPDPESSRTMGPCCEVQSVWYLYKLDRTNGRRVLEAGPVNSSLRSEGMLDLLGYDEASGLYQPGGCNGRTLASPYGEQCAEIALELGAWYVLRVVATNQAGGRKNAWSQPIMADYTQPMCTPPLLYPLDGNATNAIARV